MTQFIWPQNSHFTPLQFLTLYLHPLMISKHIILPSYTTPVTNSGPLKPLINSASLKKLKSLMVFFKQNFTTRRGHSCPSQNRAHSPYPPLPLSWPPSTSFVPLLPSRRLIVTTRLSLSYPSKHLSLTLRFFTPLIRSFEQS